MRVGGIRILETVKSKQSTVGGESVADTGKVALEYSTADADFHKQDYLSNITNRRASTSTRITHFILLMLACRS